MSATRFTTHALLASITLLLAAPANAEMLLAEFKWSQAFEVTVPAPYAVDTERSLSSVRAGYSDVIDQLPHQSFLSTDLVEQFDRVFAHHPSDGVFIRFWNGGIQGEHAVEPNKVGCGTCVFSRLVGAERAEWLERTTAEGWEAQAFVPLMSGTNLWGYQLTAIERTITAESQSLRFIGIAVPEPGTWLLVLHISMGRLLVRRSRRSCC